MVSALGMKSAGIQCDMINRSFCNHIEDEKVLDMPWFKVITVIKGGFHFFFNLVLLGYL